MAAQTGAGIQELMAAETRASQIVAEARMGTWSIPDIAYFLSCVRVYKFCFNTFSFLLRTIGYRPWGPHEAGQGGCSRFD